MSLSPSILESEPRPAPALSFERLPRYLLCAYALLIIYASLYPFADWRDPALSIFYFVSAAWPRYWTAFDLATNMAAYVPLGFLLALSLEAATRRWVAALAAIVLASLLSFSIESLQTWLPSRIASNVDWASNSAGAALGALLSWWRGPRLFSGLARLQQNLLAPLPYAELGLVLVGLWLLTQLSLETSLFGAGDLRLLFEITPTIAYEAHSFFAIETGIIVCETLAIGLIGRSILNGRSSSYWALAAFFALALLIRALAAAILVGPQDAFIWLTPGAIFGLLIGWALLALALLLPASFRVALACLALMAGTVFVNLAPTNPYSAMALSAWRQGHFLNFNGATRLTARLWPFLALFYLTLFGRTAEPAPTNGEAARHSGDIPR